jgi:hypothetical protein
MKLEGYLVAATGMQVCAANKIGGDLSLLVDAAEW